VRSNLIDVECEIVAERDRLKAALMEIDARRHVYLYHDAPWELSDFGNAFQCGSQQAHEDCSNIARAALTPPPPDPVF
jgi:hypothetical protein